MEPLGVCPAFGTETVERHRKIRLLKIVKVHCERIPHSLLRGKREKWEWCFFTPLHFEDSLQLAAGNLQFPFMVCFLTGVPPVGAPVRANDDFRRM